MVALTNTFPEATGVLRRALNQAARELLLAQSSDWAFIMKTGTVVPYAVRRTQGHIGNFIGLDEQITGNRIDQRWLGELEAKNNIFPDLDYRIYSSSDLTKRQVENLALAL
jgi:1,4-alpha-glucan branching enzyme